MSGKPSVQGSYGINKSPSTEGWGYFSEGNPSFLRNKHIICMFGETLAHPFSEQRAIEDQRIRPTQTRLCRALPLPNRQKASTHSSQTSRRRNSPRRIILGLKRDLVRKRMAKLLQAHLTKFPRAAAADNTIPRRKLEYELIYSSGRNGTDGSVQGSKCIAS
jgi:hypothetical protein